MSIWTRRIIVIYGAIIGFLLGNFISFIKENRLGKVFDLKVLEQRLATSVLAIISKEEVMSQEIYDLVENKSLSYPQNNKIKNDTIKKINNKLEKVLGIKEFIKSKKLPEDARVLVYYTEDSDLFYKNNKTTR